MRLSDVCQELSQTHVKLTREQRARNILSARERVFSACSNRSGSALDKQAESGAAVTNGRPPRAPARTFITSNCCEDDETHDVHGMTATVQPTEPEQRSNSRAKSFSRATSAGKSSIHSCSRVTSAGKSSIHSCTSAGDDEDNLSMYDGQSIVSRKSEVARVPSAQSYASYRTGPLSTSMTCIRERSRCLTGATEQDVRPLSRHCCDVLGPNSCYYCYAIHRRFKDTLRYEVTSPLFNVSEKMFADLISLKKYLPNMSEQQIEELIVSDQLEMLPLRERLHRKREKTVKELMRRQRFNSDRATDAPQPAPQLRMLSATNGETYFKNIGHLQDKMNSGKINNKLIGYKSGTLDYWKPLESRLREIKQNETFSQIIAPSYVSPTVAWEESKPGRYVQPFPPPLLPKVCQNTQPAFFAGKQEPYVLPERLPEVVVEGQIDNLSAFEAAWTDTTDS